MASHTMPVESSKTSETVKEVSFDDAGELQNMKPDPDAAKLPLLACTETTANTKRRILNGCIC